MKVYKSYNKPENKLSGAINQHLVTVYQDYPVTRELTTGIRILFIRYEKKTSIKKIKRTYYTFPIETP